MQFAMKPDFFGLNESESRLLAPRLAFLKLMQVPRGRQFKIHGNVVNVPAEVSETVNMLPRLLSETGTIKVNLKRRLQYKSSALSLNIRPHKVVQAANWLVTNSTLYRQEGITVNQAWGEECTSNFLFDDRILKMKLKNCKIFTTVLVMPQIIHVLPLVKLLRLKISGVRMKQKYLLELLTLC